MASIKETRPEQYLREIRDLQKQNAELLQKLYTIEEHQVSSKRWATVFHILTMLLPYIFSAYLSWVFYEKVQDSFNSFKEFIVHSPSRVTKTVTESVKNHVNAVTDTGEALWNQRGELYEKGKDLFKTYTGN